MNIAYLFYNVPKRNPFSEFGLFDIFFSQQLTKRILSINPFKNFIKTLKITMLKTSNLNLIRKRKNLSNCLNHTNEIPDYEDNCRSRGDIRKGREFKQVKVDFYELIKTNVNKRPFKNC